MIDIITNEHSSYQSPAYQPATLEALDSMIMLKQLRNFAITTAIFSCTVPVGCTIGRPDWIAVGTRGMVASDSAHASQIGVDILRRGGNAVDAATAVSFALAVTRPYSTGLGGGGFLIYRDGASGRVRVVDFRETAPAAATSDMYERARREGRHGREPSRTGALAVGVPGLVAGRIEIHRQLGTLPLAELTKPAADLARRGFNVDGHYVDTCRNVLRLYQREPELINSCAYVYRTHLRNGNLPSVGDRLVQPELARLLDAVGAGGAEVFYRGPVADALAKCIQARGGIITAEDLRNYRIVDRESIRSTYRDYELIMMPPPSSGGICIAQTLNILEQLNFTAVVRENPALSDHYFAEAMKHAFADRSRWPADPDFVSVPTTRLISKTYARQLAKSLHADRTHEVDVPYGITQLPDDAGTSHFCIVDQWGNVVVSTETINTAFGSLTAVDEWGLILNNEMDDFAAYSNKANAFGLIQSQCNAPEPGKRPLSSMSPTIVLRNGRPVLLLGASGGPRIISSVLNVMLNILDRDMPLAVAMMALRLHHQWQPNEIVFDRTPPKEVVDALTARGHTVSNRRKTGIVQAIQLTGSQLIGISDPRKGGKPAGY